MAKKIRNNFHEYESGGMPLVHLPTGENDWENARRRGIADLESVTAAQMIDASGLCTDLMSGIVCGDYAVNFPLILQLTRMASRPILLIGTDRDFHMSPCLRNIGFESEFFQLEDFLPDANCVMTLSPDPETALALTKFLPQYSSHLIVLCLGCGLQADPSTLNTLCNFCNFILLTNFLQRGVTRGLTSAQLLKEMDYVALTSIGTAASDLISILPSFEAESITNSQNINLHWDSPSAASEGSHRGNGIFWGQSRTLQSRPILTQDDLRSLQENGYTVIYRAASARTWVGRIMK